MADKDEVNTVEEQEEFLRLLKQLRLADNPGGSGQSIERDFKFWKTQPVPGFDEKPDVKGPIDEPKTVDQVRQEPYAMPAGFEWVDIDFAEPSQAQEVYDLLNKNYVEDDDNMFRFDYSIEFLKWALTPPGYIKNWHVGVRNQKTGKLMGFISGIPVQVRVYDSTMSMAEVNFLCVHKKLRAKRLAPVLIKEITRRVNLLDIWQAVYTAGVVLPMPLAQCRYYHRSLNPKKLIEVGFSALAPRMTMTRTVKMYKLPEEVSLEGFRPMEEKDVATVTLKLNEYLVKMELAQHYSEDEVRHLMLPREGVISSFVIEKEGVVKDFCSYYHLNSTVINHEKHSTLNAAYSYFNVATSVPLQDLMHAALIMAKRDGADVFNALAVMENMTFLHDLKFSPGDGDLNYYLYNWRCPRMEGDKVGMVLC